jgi:hypothetical protein
MTIVIPVATCLAQGTNHDQEPWSKNPGTPRTSMVWFDLSPEDSVSWGNMSNQGRLTITSRAHDRTTPPCTMPVRSPLKHQGPEKAKKKRGNRHTPQHHCSNKLVTHSITLSGQNSGSPSVVTTLIDPYEGSCKEENVLKDSDEDMTMRKVMSYNGPPSPKCVLRNHNEGDTELEWGDVSRIPSTTTSRPQEIEEVN